MNSTDSALPASRQPVPPSPEVQAEVDRHGRSVAEIERDIKLRTQSLAANIDELAASVAPGRLMADGAEQLKSRVVTSDGKPRPEVIGAVAGAAIVGGLLFWWARRH